MGNNAVKTIVLMMALVVLSVLVGAQVSDSLSSSLGAFATIGCIMTVFFMLWLGKNSWYLIFLVPPFLSRLLASRGFELPSTALIAVAVGVYWMVMWIMGYVRFKWHSLPVLDMFVLIIATYMVVNYYRYPVSIKALGMEGDMVGGKDYIIALLSVLGYVVISAIPWQLESLLKCLKWAFFVGLAVSLSASIWDMLTPTASIGIDAEAGAGEVLEHGRFSFFVAPGTMLLTYLYYRYPLVSILTSFRKSVLMLFAVCCIMVSGWRTRMIHMFVHLAFIALLKREMTALVLIGMFAYMGVFGLGSMGLLEEAPYGLQRVLSALPGISVSDEASRDTEGSSDIRVRMWKNAMDPRTGLIRDYIWGDGFQSSRAEIERDHTQELRSAFARTTEQQQEYMERHGSWHNGWITYLHRLGIVGLIVLQLFLLVSAVYLFRVGAALLRVPDGVFGYVPACGFLPITFTSSFLVWIVGSVFAVFSAIALTKVLYCLLLERGLLAPMFVRQAYVPMTIRERERQTVSF